MSIVHMTYVHDAEEEMLYAFPTEPTVEEKQNRWGDNKAWIVSVEVTISSPNNVCKKGRWLIPLSDTYKAEYPVKTKAKAMIKDFKSKYYPRGQYLKLPDYEELKRQYDEKSGIW